MRSPKTRAPCEAAMELMEYFGAGDGDQGLRSFSLAPGGGGGGRDPEAWVTDRRFRLGPPGENATLKPIERAKLVRSALAGLAPQNVHVLWLAYGPHAWEGAFDAFGKGKGIQVVRALDLVVGVALFAPTVAREYAKECATRPVVDETEPDPQNRMSLYREDDEHLRERAIAAAGGRPLRAEHAGLYDTMGFRLEWAASEVLPPSRRPDEKAPRRARESFTVLPGARDARPPVWDNAGGWLVAACVSERKEDRGLIEKVKREAEAMLAGALDAYRTARGMRPRAPEEREELADVAGRQRRPRARRTEPRQYLEGAPVEATS